MVLFLSLQRILPETCRQHQEKVTFVVCLPVMCGCEDIIQTNKKKGVAEKHQYGHALITFVHFLSLPFCTVHSYGANAMLGGDGTGIDHSHKLCYI
jgi:hypothetical protein